MMIRERNFGALKQTFAEWPPADLAELITDLPPEDQVIVFRILPHDLAASSFEYLDRESQRRLLQGMGKEEVVQIINEMSPDDRTALLEELPSTAVTQLLQLLTPEELAKAKTLLGYPEKSVGRLMTPDFISVKEEWTVQQVLDHIRKVGKDSETINIVYVTDESGNLIDDVRIREFLLRPLGTKVAEIRDHTSVSLQATDSETDAIQVFRKYDRTALPVVDSKGKLVGIVTVDDILDVAEKEATEGHSKTRRHAGVRRAVPGGKLPGNDPETGALAYHSFSQRDVDSNRHGFFPGRNCKSGCVGLICSTDYFERRQLWFLKPLP
jgi:magnesium transporter